MIQISNGVTFLFPTSFILQIDIMATAAVFILHPELTGFVTKQQIYGAVDKAIGKGALTFDKGFFRIKVTKTVQDRLLLSTHNQPYKMPSDEEIEEVVRRRKDLSFSFESLRTGQKRVKAVLTSDGCYLP